MSSVDLHSHTYYSDGALSPEALILRAVEHHVSLLAITDHDNIEALPIASEVITHQKLPIELINGVEISTQWEGFDIHIVGLRFDLNAKPLRELLVKQQQCRIIRAEKIGQLLEKKSFQNAYEHASQLALNGIPARPHFAQYLINIGAVKDVQAAFRKYLRKGACAYVKTNWCSIEEAVDVIHKSGGVAVLAHPLRYDLSAKWIKKLLETFKIAKGDAIEVIQNRQTADDNKRLANYALEYGFLASKGSDFHSACAWSDFGKLAILPENVVPVWHNWGVTAS